MNRKLHENGRSLFKVVSLNLHCGSEEKYENFGEHNRSPGRY